MKFLNKSMKKYLFSLIAIIVGVLASGPVLAFCPVCTVAVAGGVGLAQYLGIDDTVTGVWVGGLTVSLIAWTLVWFDKKNIHFHGRKIITIVSYYALIVAPLFFTGILGHVLNKIWGIDRLLVGIIAGSIVFLIAGLWYESMKRKNNNHAYFPYQKVVMSVGSLIIVSGLFYILTKYIVTTYY